MTDANDEQGTFKLEVKDIVDVEIRLVTGEMADAIDIHAIADNVADEIMLRFELARRS